MPTLVAKFIYNLYQDETNQGDAELDRFVFDSAAPVYTALSLFNFYICDRQTKDGTFLVHESA